MSVKYSTLLKFINNCDGSRENFESFINASSDSEVLALDFMKGARILDNANLSDDEMGTQQPSIKINVNNIVGRTDRAFTYSLEDFNYFSQEDDVRFFFSAWIDGQKIDLIGNENFEWKRENEISFDRVGGYLNRDVSTEVSVSQYQTTNNIKGVECGTLTIDNPFIKSIKDNTISSEGYLNLFIDNQRVTELDVSIDIFGRGASGTAIRMTPYNVLSTLLNMASGLGFFSLNVIANTSSNIWIFENETDLDDYLRTGDYSKATNYNDEVKPNPTKETKYYMHCDIKRSLVDREVSKMTMWQQNYINFYANNELSYRPICGYLLDNKSPYNVKLVVKNYNVFSKVEQSFDGGLNYEETSANAFTNEKWGYSKYNKVQIGTAFFNYNNKTNIPIFGSEEDCNDYFNGIIDENSSIVPIIPNIPESEIGDDKNASELNNLYLPVVLSKTLIMNYQTLQEVSRTLYDEQSIDEILDGLKLMGETPLNFICDLFALPFNPKPFCTTSVSNTMFYGLYSVQMQNSFDEIVSNNNILTMFSTPIVGQFKDWRDYEQRYYLYLPYVGITAIDIEKFMYKTMTCKVQVDVRTGTVKYYLLSNNTVVDTFEGSVRLSMPIIGTNNFAATMSKIGAVSNIATSVVGTATAGVGALAGSEQGLKGGIDESVGKFASKSVGGLASTIGSNIENISTLTGASPKHCSGNFSSQTAMFDELTAYLIIDSADIVYPDNIKTEYNLPDNRVATLSSCKGYTQADLVKLQTSANENEQAEILSILQGGIII